jgi:hypothetical protein
VQRRCLASSSRGGCRRSCPGRLSAISPREAAGDLIQGHRPVISCKAPVLIARVELIEGSRGVLCMFGFVIVMFCFDFFHVFFLWPAINLEGS